MTFAILLTTLSAVALTTCAVEPPAADAVPIGGGALVSADAKFIFAPAKSGGIEALDLATGKVMWTNTDAKRLAGASDKLVIGWAGDEKKPNTFRVIVIDAATGKTVTKSDAFEMPEWAATARTWGRSFRIAAHADAAPIVVWQANAFYAGGARPTPEIEAAARKEAAGAVSIDLKTGKLAALDRKPKEDEFKPGPEGRVIARLGPYEFQAREMDPRPRPGVPMVTTVTLTVLKGKAELWKRELAGNPWSPPRP